MAGGMLSRSIPGRAVWKGKQSNCDNVTASQPVPRLKHKITVGGISMISKSQRSKFILHAIPNPFVRCRQSTSPILTGNLTAWLNCFYQFLVRQATFKHLIFWETTHCFTTKVHHAKVNSHVFLNISVLKIPTLKCK